MRCAHARAATATAASCSRVVPNSNMWRAAASAYMVTGYLGRYAVS
ncbi:hypothetical protein [Pseudolysinimonas kribbensis]|nr:hypothetical protein [Pseudolysinimonas kribbensis]